MRAFRQIRLLAWTSIILIAIGESAANTNSNVFEVDTLFPRNETYTPQPLMPIVFGVQNPQLAKSLEVYMTWDLWEGNNYSSPGSINGGLIEINAELLTPNEKNTLRISYHRHCFLS